MKLSAKITEINKKVVLLQDTVKKLQNISIGIEDNVKFVENNGVFSTNKAMNDNFYEYLNDDLKEKIKIYQETIKNIKDYTLELEKELQVFKG